MTTRFEQQSQEYKEMLDEIYELFVKKGKDYGEDGDHFKNLRACETLFDIPAEIGVCIRIIDKIQRIITMWKKGELQNESAEDSMKDIIVYAGNMFRIFCERRDKWTTTK